MLCVFSEDATNAGMGRFRKGCEIETNYLDGFVGKVGFFSGFSSDVASTVMSGFVPLVAPAARLRDRN